MLSLLTDKLPEEIEICGKLYPIETDFRIWLRFESVFLDAKPDKETILAFCLDVFNLKKNKVMPPEWLATMKALTRFYVGDLKTEKKVGHSANKHMAPTFDFSYDSGYIYAAFIEIYAIDLRKVDYMHWYEFKALLQALPDTCKLKEIIGYRSADTARMSNEERKYYRKMKEFYALPDKRSTEERDEVMIRNLMSAF